MEAGEDVAEAARREVAIVVIVIVVNIVIVIVIAIAIVIVIVIVAISLLIQVMEETGLEFELSTLFLVETAQGSWYR